MDLIAGKQHLIVMMEHRDSKDRAKLVSECEFPLTGIRCVDLIVTDLAILRRDNDAWVLEEVADGFTPAEVIALADMEIREELPAR